MQQRITKRTAQRSTLIGVLLLMVFIIAVVVVSIGANGSLDTQPTGTQSIDAQPTEDGMLLIPAGEFTMGSKEGNSNEQPVHTVYLDAFYIDQHEVTNAGYRACVNAGGCQPLPDISSETHNFYHTNPEFADYPVVRETWREAQTYCEWSDARLPSEAEWEKAARGVDARIYPWGDNFNPAYLNYCDSNCAFLPWADLSNDDGYADTAPVGSYQGASPYGVHDMAGNAWEWVADWYVEDYYAKSPRENPGGPQSGSSEQRVTRGGGYVNDYDYVRTTARRRFTPTTRSSSVGFRCVRSAE